MSNASENLPPNVDDPDRPLLPGQGPVPPRLPSTRVAAVLAAGMLALGVTVGAAIGPGVGGADSTLAGERIPLLLPTIAALAAGSGAHTASTSTPTTVQPPSVTPQPTPAASSPSTG